MAAQGCNLAGVERSLLEESADEVAEVLDASSKARWHVVEIGAGAAERAQILLRALVRRQGRTLLVAVEQRTSALRQAQARLARDAPGVELRSLAVAFERNGADGLAPLQLIGSRTVALLGTAALGRLDETDAVDLLRSLRAHLGRAAALLVVIQRPQNPAALLASFDDARGFAAAFNKNALARINRELAGHFDLERFAHRVRWNGAASAVELHLESLLSQRVRIDALGAGVSLRHGETIQTGSFRTWSESRIDRLFEQTGWRRRFSRNDERGRCALHFCRGV